MYFYPRPPGGGRLAMRKASNDLLFIFLSTPSGWRATKTAFENEYNTWKFLSTPSGWRATPDTPPTPPEPPISIHALRVEGDKPSPRKKCVSFYFYPRPPGGGRPWRGCILVQLCRISIHALRVEGDVSAALIAAMERNFYPRPPGGGRLVAIAENNMELSISIHALRVEGDSGFSSAS